MWTINSVKAIGDIVNLVLATGDGYIYSEFNLTAFFHFSHLIALWSRYQNLCWPHPGGLKPVDADLSFKTLMHQHQRQTPQQTWQFTQEDERK